MGFEGFDLEAAIGARARRSGIDLAVATCRGLAEHARAVARDGDVLHLTAITEPAEFVERHLGESFEGASLLEPEVSGRLVDLGSGNGYPGLPLAAARPGLEPVLIEASRRKASFLREVARFEGVPAAMVLEMQVQRAADLEPIGPLDAIVTRALGGWERLLPKLAPSLAPGGRVLLWAGPSVEAVSRRAAWRKLRLAERHSLPGRSRSWIWVFRPAV